MRLRVASIASDPYAISILDPTFTSNTPGFNFVDDCCCHSRFV